MPTVTLDMWGRNSVQGLARTRLPTPIMADADDGLPASAETEADLIARATHDSQAFAFLYRRYLDPVYRYCYHRLGSKEAAEDVTSQVFSKVLGAQAFKTPDGRRRRSPSSGPDRSRGGRRCGPARPTGP